MMLLALDMNSVKKNAPKQLVKKHAENLKNRTSEVCFSVDSKPLDAELILHQLVVKKR